MPAAMKRTKARLSAPVDRSKIIVPSKNLPELPLVKASALTVWYVDATDLEAKVLGSEGKRVEFKDVEKWNELVKKKKELAGRLLAQYSHDYESWRGQNGDIKMLFMTQRSGTAADKVSAFSILVAENPIANMRSLDALLAMVTSKVGKRHALTGFETLRELFISSLLPDRKLKSLFQRPINHLPESKDGHSLLLFWYWEECLKQRYERYILALEEASKDMLPVLKDRSLKALYLLLKCKPEQERKLLSALVNKLGDPESKAASNACYHLTKLLSEHPNMKSVVIEEVDSFLFRPHLGIQAKYHAINFLSQFHLTAKGEGPMVAKRLLDVYFAVFKVLISLTVEEQKTDKSGKTKNEKTQSSLSKKKSESSTEHIEKESRILSAILTGVNRAFPFVSSCEIDEVIEVQTPMLFQLVHSKNFNVGVQALMLLYKISSKNQIASDRFFRALYSKLLLPAALNSSKAEMFIALLQKSMQNDINLKRVCAFSKRILQIALQQPPQFACGCLILLSNVLESKPSLWKMMFQNESMDEDDLEHFEDILEETDNEQNTTSMKSEAPRKGSPYSKSKDVASSSSDSDSSEESEKDLIVSDDLNSFRETKPISNHIAGSFSLPGGYNPRHREPSHCNANRVSWWELEVLASHVHPSVAAMGRTLLAGAHIVYYGNPSTDFSLPAFLDKFMEKKPKQSTWHGGSLIEPAKKVEINNHLLGAEILSLAEADVAPEDLVFHKFYMKKMSSSSKKSKKKKKKKVDADAEGLYGSDEDDESEDDDEIEHDNPLLEANGDYDYDDLDALADEDDEDLVNASDAEMESVPGNVDFDDDDDDDDIDVGDMDDEDGKKHGKPNSRGKKKVSSFAPAEEYEHLIKAAKKKQKRE